MIDILHDITLIIWSSFTTFLFIGIVAQLYKVKSGTEKEKNVEFVITSIASDKVAASLFAAIENIKTRFPEYGLTILIDSGSFLEERLKSLQTGMVRTISVPTNYNKTIVAKGRAIDYFISQYINSDTWYAFIDDDNQVEDDKFLYEIPVYESKGYLICNPILKPRAGKSETCFVMDWVRYFDDLTIFRFFTGLVSSPIMGLHGELLCVKGSVLRAIGFQRYTLTEDFRFAAEVVRNRYKTWQSRTIVSIKSPNSIMDLLRQRGRWFIGLTKDLPYVPLSMKIVVGWRLLLWSSSLLGSWVIGFAWMFLYPPFYWFMPGGLYYLVVYLYAIKKNRNIIHLFYIPFFGIIEGVSFVNGLVRKNFVVIDKS